MIAEHPFRKGIKFSCPDVGFKLPVPVFRIKLRKPPSKCGDLRRSQLLDLHFQVLYLAYTRSPFSKYIISVHRHSNSTSMLSSFPFGPTT